MRFRQIITTEEADATSTTAGDIASVAYPLFVPGRSRRAKRRAARLAVGQRTDSGASYIGRGVYENTRPADRELDLVRKLGALGNRIAQNPKLWDRYALAVNNNDLDWIIDLIQNQTGASKEEVMRLSDLFGDIGGGLGRITDFAWAAKDDTWQDDFAKPYLKYRQQNGVAEAHTLNSDNVIYRLDREDPMNASEVLVLGGAGRYSIAGLRDKARREARALAADLEGNHGGAFRGAAHNIKQLTNTLNTIVAAYNELKRIRSRGGRGSRGITDEDANFIRECLKIAEQWTQRYIAENGRNPGTPIPFPPGTTEVDVSDTTAWYRLGLEISDLDDAEPEEFNQGPPHTIITFANDETEQPYLKQFKRLGFKVKDIDQPDVRKFSKQEKRS